MRMRLILSVGLISLLLLMTPKPVAACGGTWHTVWYGQTLFSIGRHYNVNPWSIASANGLVNPNHIYAGQRLYIPTGCWGTPPCYGCGTYHMVRSGDTLLRIARLYGVNAWSIARANGIYNMNYIWVGQRLYIPAY